MNFWKIFVIILKYFLVFCYLFVIVCARIVV